MRRFPLVVLVGLLLGAPAVVAHAPQKKVERAPHAEADPLAAQRRATATSLLTSLADKVRTFRDGTLRARAQARAADALWELDPELSRAPSCEKGIDSLGMGASLPAFIQWHACEGGRGLCRAGSPRGVRARHAAASAD